jgi:hypothetical protein
MKYEKPELTVLSLAIGAIQGISDTNKATLPHVDSLDEEGASAYADWED